MALSLPVTVDFGMGAALNNILLLMIVFMFFCVISVVSVGLFYMLSYRIKAIVFPLVASGNGDNLAVGKMHHQRFKWNHSKNSWKPMWPLFRAKDIEPFDAAYIYAGKRVLALELPNHDYIPVRMQLNSKIGEKDVTIKDLVSELNPIPHHLRKWNEIELQEDEMQFSKHNFWTDNKGILMVLVCSFLCLLLCGLTIYFTFKFAGGKTDVIISQAQTITDYLQRINTIPAATP